jgi:hypothetical protein
MRKFWVTLGLILMVLTACRNRPAEEQATASPPPAASPSISDNEQEPVPSPDQDNLEPATPVTDQREETEEPLSITPTAEPENGPTEAPAPTLFDTAWRDRSPFQAGLVDSETGVLEELAGATVYHMDLNLSDDLFSAAGRQEVLYTNQETTPLDAVYFHLFPNLLGGQIDVSAVTVNSEPVTAGYLNQDTILHIPLRVPLAPGDQVVIQMEFLVDIPTEGGSNYGVFATIDGVLALAHFYPQISVFDDEDWNIALPPDNADVTYADTSFYLVRLSAPVNQVVVASGTEIDRQLNDNRQILTIASGPTRDFYIASSDRYIVVSDTVGQTTVKSYGFPEFTERTEQALGFALAAMESFNNRFGTYPFTEFEVAPTPNLALGVEYPGVVVINSRIYDPAETFGSTPSGFYLESTVVHEVGHQWFYSVIGNDQLDEPWVDESLTQYATYLYFVDEYGPDIAEGFRQSLYSRWDVLDQAEIPIGMPAGNYQGSEYSAIVYGRGPLFFEALSNTLGEAAFNAFIRDYYQTYQWDIATGPGLKALAEKHCSCDLTPLFAEWVGES